MDIFYGKQIVYRIDSTAMIQCQDTIEWNHCLENALCCDHQIQIALHPIPLKVSKLYPLATCVRPSKTETMSRLHRQFLHPLFGCVFYFHIIHVSHEPVLDGIATRYALRYLIFSHTHAIPYLYSHFFFAVFHFLPYSTVNLAGKQRTVCRVPILIGLYHFTILIIKFAVVVSC